MSTCSTPRRSTTTTSTSPRSSRCSATATRSTPTSSPRRPGWPVGSSSWAGSTSCRSTRSRTRRTSAPTSSSRPGTRRASTRCRGRPASAASPTTSTSRAASSRRRDDLFDPEFNGKIGMLTEMRDTMGLIMLSMGIDITTLTDFATAEPAFAKLEQAKNDGQIRASPATTTSNDLSNGQLRGVRRLVGRRGPAGARQSGRPVHHPGGGRNRLGRHDGDAEGCGEPRRCGEVDGLRLRPGAGSPTHRMRCSSCRRSRVCRRSWPRSIRSWPRTRCCSPTRRPSRVRTTSPTCSEDVEAEYDAAFSAITGA